MKKLLIYSIFPAPYRTAVFEGLNREFELTVLFERNSDANRDPSWFVNDFQYPCFILDNERGKEYMNNVLYGIRNFDAVGIYDYATVSAIRIIHLCKKHKIPYFLNCDGSFINRSFIKDKIKRYIIKDSSLCLASGEYAKQYYLTYGAKSKSIVIHKFSSLLEKDIVGHPLSVFEKRKIRSELNLPIDGKMVLTIGQFTHRKGFDVLLESWKKINNKYNLVIIGGGEDQKLYEDFIVKNALKNVSLLGYKSKEIVFKYYKAADLFILPTREDIWGLVVNEAMACGTPVVTTNRCIAGLELIDNGEQGYIIATESSDQIVISVEKIFKDENVYRTMCENCLIRIQDYTIERMINRQLIAINDSVVRHE